jgi:hypothetical protein
MMILFVLQNAPIVFESEEYQTTAATDAVAEDQKSILFWPHDSVHAT